MLLEQRKKHEAIAIEAWSSDALWEKARGLTLQQRCEILGPPAGYEPLFAMGGVGGREAGDLREGRILIVQDIASPIDLGAIVEAIRPDVPLGPPVFVRPAPGDWTEAVAYQRQVVSEALARSRDLRPRFAVFSLAPIPLAVHLGFALSDRVDAAPYQFHRDRRSWTWGDERIEPSISVSGLPDAPVPGAPEAIIRVSLSARIAAEDTAAVVPGGAVRSR
ncbi:MAG TPA: SAVED domain-containing protein [Methylomirabilota bacterium]|nr:SAVED domain-containing protein [Methylomirabilota bacterium]